MGTATTSSTSVPTTTTTVAVTPTTTTREPQNHPLPEPEAVNPVTNTPVFRQNREGLPNTGPSYLGLWGLLVMGMGLTVYGLNRLADDSVQDKKRQGPSTRI
jgi:hypothetical protein